MTASTSTSDGQHDFDGTCILIMEARGVTQCSVLQSTYSSTCTLTCHFQNTRAVPAPRQRQRAAACSCVAHGHGMCTSNCHSVALAGGPEPQVTIIKYTIDATPLVAAHRSLGTSSALPTTAAGHCSAAAALIILAARAELSNSWGPGRPQAPRHLGWLRCFSARAARWRPKT